MFKNDKRSVESTGFVDGDWVESFLDMSPVMRERVVSGEDGGVKMGCDVAQVLQLLEEMAQYH